MNLCVTVYEFSPSKVGKTAVLEKSVPWTVLPPKAAVIFCGREMDGEESSVNAYVSRVGWYSNGNIDVEADIRGC